MVEPLDGGVERQDHERHVDIDEPRHHRAVVVEELKRHEALAEEKTEADQRKGGLAEPPQPFERGVEIALGAEDGDQRIRADQ